MAPSSTTYKHGSATGTQKTLRICKSIISLSEWEGSNAVLKVWNKPPNRTVGAVYAAEQRTNALWTATRYELSFQHGNLIVWYWFSAGCAGGDRFCRRSLRPA